MRSGLGVADLDRDGDGVDRGDDDLEPADDGVDPSDLEGDLDDLSRATLGSNLAEVTSPSSTMVRFTSPPEAGACLRL